MISRRTFVTGLATAAAGSSLSLKSSMARVWQGVNFTPIRRGVGTFVQQGGTIGYLATQEALVVVDTQYPDPARTCLDGLTERTGRTVDVLINTHHHGDHTSGNGVFSADARQFVAHQEAARLKASALASGGANPAGAIPTTTFSEHLRLDLGNETMDLRHYGPAHTGGDAVVHFEEADVVHMGDLVFNRMPPFIDRPAGASIAGWMQLLETVHDRFSDDTVFIFGHAGPNHDVTGTRDDLLAMRDFLDGLLNYVRSGMAGGRGVDELAQASRLPDFPIYYLDSWADAIPNAIRVAHQELTHEN